MLGKKKKKEFLKEFYRILKSVLRSLYIKQMDGFKEFHFMKKAERWRIDAFEL